jgi:16S rRNA processing protein RimM
MALNKYLLCAKIVGTHGVRGNVRLENYCDTPKILAGLKRLYYKKPDGSYEEYKVEKRSVQKDAVLAKLEGVETLEDAIVLKGRELYADREDFRLRKGDYFVADQIGLPVIDAESGEKVGKVREIMTGRIQDIYVIEDVNGGTFMVPSVPDFIKKVSVEGDDAGVYVALIDGMRE